MRKTLFAMAILLVAVATGVGAETLPVVGVVDGDTIIILDKGIEKKVDIKGIDAPELSQPYGENSKEFLITLLKGHDKVTVQNLVNLGPGGQNADIIIGSRDAAINMVWEGFAWVGKRNTSSSLNKIEKQAKKAKRGLWVQSDAQPPWGWREAHQGQDVERIDLSEAVGRANQREAEERARKLAFLKQQQEAIEKMQREDPVGYSQWLDEQRHQESLAVQKRQHQESLAVQKKILNATRNIDVDVRTTVILVP